jgi:flagellar hook protein FlgE
MSLEISASGMRLATVRQRVTANNIANISTPGFKAARVQATEHASAGVRVGSIGQDSTPGLPLPVSFDGGPPLEGSNVDLTTESVGLFQNRGLFQANASAFRVQADLLGELLDLNG